MLNECLTVTVCRPEISPKSLLNIGDPQKGLNEIKNAGDGDARPKTPSPLNDIKIYGEVSFTHKVISRRTTRRLSSNIVVSGGVDHVIGRILETRVMNAVKQRKRRFYSLLILVDAKFERSASQALAQLIVYLASLHQSRLQRNRLDASVYGLVSDGYFFIFVKITHDGTVMLSRQLDALQGDMKKVLGCLKHILEITASRSPKSTLERNDGDSDDDEVDESDPQLHLDDNKFMNPPVGDGEDDTSIID